MCNIKALFGFFLFLALFSKIDVVFSSEFVPWTKADNAVYIDSFNNTNNVTIDQHVANWIHFTDFAGFGPLWIKTSTDDERVYFRSSENRRKQIFVDFDKPEGTKTEVDIPPCNTGSVEIKDKQDQVSVPAGTFGNVVRLDFETSCADGGVTSAWFASGVGPIKWESSNIVGIVISEMIQASIGEADFPQGLVVKAIFPDPIVAIDLEPPVDPDRPATTVDVFLTIKNSTERELRYLFNSGQRFEITLFDADGNVVSLWSRGRAFTAAIELITVNRGETLSFGGPIELRDDNGEDLSGSFTLKIEMASSPDPDTDHMPGSERISATVPLTIFLAL